MVSKSFHDFYEVMQHDFVYVPPLKEPSGYKVDEKRGIKVHCQLNDYKSVDYFLKHEEKYVLLEFSDLLWQQTDFTPEITAIGNSNLDEPFKTKHLKAIDQRIHQELREKYKDTLFVITQLSEHLSDVPEDLLSCHDYYVIIAPLHPQTAHSNIDPVRFLDTRIS